MSGDVLVLLVALTAWACLAWRSFRSYQVSNRKTSIMALAWIGIFGILVLVLRMGGSGE